MDIFSDKPIVLRKAGQQFHSCIVNMVNFRTLSLKVLELGFGTWERMSVSLNANETISTHTVLRWMEHPVILENITSTQILFETARKCNTQTRLSTIPLISPLFGPWSVEVKDSCAITPLQIGQEKGSLSVHSNRIENQWVF